jgi:hypothetical protein
MSYRLMARVLECAGFRPIPRLVLIVLANAADRDGYCFPGIAHIMRQSGACRGAVCSALSTLERGGWITVERCFGQSNRYRIHLPDQSTGQTAHQSTAQTGATSLRRRRHQSTGQTPPVYAVDSIRSGTPQEPSIHTGEVGRTVVAPAGGAGR